MWSSQVTNLDIEKAFDESEKNLSLINKKVIHTFPLSYKIDGREIEGRPDGMRGNKLEIKALFITCSSQHLEDLLEVVTLAGVSPLDVVASPIAGSYIALSDKDKIVGSALVDIGSETVSLAVFENNTIISLQSFSLGSANITNDIALGLKIPLEKAEIMKLENSSADHSKKKLNEHLKLCMNHERVKAKSFKENKKKRITPSWYCVHRRRFKNFRPFGTFKRRVESAFKNWHHPDV